MANEITITTSLAFTKGGVGSTLADAGLTFDVSGTDYVQGTQQVGFAAEEVLDLGDITTPGYCYMKNTDATNFVVVRGVAADTITVKLKAGEVALFRHGGTVPTVQADTAAVQINYLLIED